MNNYKRFKLGNYKNDLVGIDATMTGGDQAITTGTWTKVAFDGTDWQKGSTLSNGEITISEDGKYFLSFFGRFESSSTGMRGYQWKKDLTTLLENFVESQFGQSCTCSGIVQLVKDDVIKCQVYQNSGSNKDFLDNYPHGTVMKMAN